MTLPMQGHWGCVRIVYIGSAADGVFTIDIVRRRILLLVQA